MPIATLQGRFPGAPRVKDLKYLQLFDCYGALLTDTQREFCEMYYALDLSLSEIAEQKEISKQAVSDALKKSRELMDFYEETLHFNEMNQAYSLEVSDMMTRVERALEKFAAAHPEFSGEMKKIADLVFVGEKVDPDGEE